MSKSLNETVAEFTHAGRRYQVDRLLDSGFGDDWAYHIFDVTSGKDVPAGGELHLPHPDFMGDGELVAAAVAELIAWGDTGAP